MNIERFVTEGTGGLWSWGTLCAYPRDSLRYVQVLDRVQAMTTPSIMHLLNAAVASLDEGECYLEVGTWRGATLIGALLGNERAHGYAIDNDVMVEHNGDGRRSKEVWEDNVKEFGVASRSHYIEGTTPGVFSHLTLPPVGVYLYDGDKEETQAVIDGLEAAIPHLAPTALIFLDDANVMQIREASFYFCHHYRDRALKISDLPTPTNCWPAFWNGLQIIAWNSAGGMG